MTTSPIEVARDPGDAERDAILAALSAYNATAGPAIDARPVALLVRDDDGAIVGGLWGRIA